MPLFMWDFGPQTILDKVLQLFGTNDVLYSVEYPYGPKCKIVMKALLWWEWDLGGRSANSSSNEDLFSLEQSAVPVCSALLSTVLIRCYSGAVKEGVKQK